MRRLPPHVDTAVAREVDFSDSSPPVTPRRMIIYQNTKSGFIRSTRENSIFDEIRDSYRDRIGRRPAEAEVRSWESSLQFMANVLDDRSLPDNASVAVEFQIPSSSKRIDVLLSGISETGEPSLVVVELKQWSWSEATDKDGIVRAERYGGHDTDGPHPSYQAWSYAELLRGFNTSCEESRPEHVVVHPCAYLHNHGVDGADKSIRSSFYERYLEAAPVFLKGPAEQKALRDFIARHIKKGDDGSVVELVDSGTIRPSKELAKEVLNLLKGNPSFVLIDEQKTVFEHVKKLAVEPPRPGAKHVVIVKGGPGTGKSVVAVNLLAELTGRRLLSIYVSKNAAPRQIYEAELTGTFTKKRISNLFKGADWAWESPENAFRCILVDEAHRLRQKSGLYGNQGENQIMELIRAGEVTVFFIDDAQRITTQDVGSVEEICRQAERLGVPVDIMTLPSQFRCGGSDGYLAWIDNQLGIRETAVQTLEGIDYDFRVYDSATDMLEEIRRLNKNHGGDGARVVAGYCWDWVSKKDPEAVDIVLNDGFSMCWNFARSGGLWLAMDRQVTQVGCIHTVQGLEIPYIGVIIGPDLIVRDGEIITDFHARAKTDASIKGLKSMEKTAPERARSIGNEIIRNTYRVLMTRGIKGCFVYSEDHETREWFRRKPGRQQHSS